MKNAYIPFLVSSSLLCTLSPAAVADTYEDYNVQWDYTVDADGGATIVYANPVYSYDPVDGTPFFSWDGTIPTHMWKYNPSTGENTRYPVTAIDDSALENLRSDDSSYSPNSISIPETVRRIGSYAFSGFAYVENIDLPEGLEYLGWNPFDGCRSLSRDWEFEYQQNVWVLDGWVLGPIQYWDGVNADVESADLSTAKGIAAGAFCGCTTLRSVILPINAGTIPHSAFYGTAPTNVVIPGSVTNIEAYAFSSCSSLTNITFVGNAPSIQIDPEQSDSNPFYGVSQQCVVTVQQGTTGWGTVPGIWNGLPTQYATAPATYTITWLDSDGTLIDENSSWVPGAMPAHADPAKDSDAQYHYYFLTWTPELEPVVSNTTYTAVYSESLRHYTITWLNDDGSRINNTGVGYGSVPTHADATKAADDFYTYTFAGWTPSPVAVTGPATYRATFTATPKCAGSGTEADPFVVTSKDALLNFINATNILYVQLSPGLAITGPINVPATMTTLSIDMNGGSIAGTGNSPAIVLAGNTAFSAKGTGTISAASGVEAVQRPGSVAAASGVTITGLGSGAASGPATFAEGGEAFTSAFAPGANGTWRLTAFAELASGSADGLADSQIKVRRAATVAGLATAEPTTSGVTVLEKVPAVKVDLEVAVPPNADSQFFRVEFDE